LANYLGPVAERIKNIPFGSYPYTARVRSMIETNWKLGMEAQCESYQVRALHAKTVAKAIAAE
jgi:hypothetical protein